MVLGVDEALQAAAAATLAAEQAPVHPLSATRELAPPPSPPTRGAGGRWLSGPDSGEALRGDDEACSLDPAAAPAPSSPLPATSSIWALREGATAAVGLGAAAGGEEIVAL